MRLNVRTDIAPMEARLVDKLPVQPGWLFEPKWDGFRCLSFRDGGEVELRAKSGKSLNTFFPDIVATIADLPSRKLVLDGELLIAVDGIFRFDALQMRLHPAQSRVAKLAREQPATFVAFDCLLDLKGHALLRDPFEKRRAVLETLFSRYGNRGGLALTPSTHDRNKAARWLNSRRLQIDGVIAKQLHLPYEPGKRAMLKVKRRHTADCVVGGFRYESDSCLVGSLLLGLYDNNGLLHHVGFTSAIPTEEKPALTKQLKTLIASPGFTGSAPGAPSRWTTRRSSEWQPLRPELVVEVRYDHSTGKRFRHGTKLVRWRPDKSPRQCTFEQLVPIGIQGERVLS